MRPMQTYVRTRLAWGAYALLAVASACGENSPPPQGDHDGSSPTHAAVSQVDAAPESESAAPPRPGPAELADAELEWIESVARLHEEGAADCAALATRLEARASERPASMASPSVEDRRAIAAHLVEDPARTRRLDAAMQTIMRVGMQCRTSPEFERAMKAWGPEPAPGRSEGAAADSP